MRSLQSRIPNTCSDYMLSVNHYISAETREKNVYAFAVIQESQTYARNYIFLDKPTYFSNRPNRKDVLENWESPKIVDAIAEIQNPKQMSEMLFSLSHHIFQQKQIEKIPFLLRFTANLRMRSLNSRMPKRDPKYSFPQANLFQQKPYVYNHHIFLKTFD